MITRLRDWLFGPAYQWRLRYEAEHEYTKRLEAIQRGMYTDHMNALGELAATRHNLNAAMGDLAAYDRAISTGSTVAEARATIEAEAREAEIEAQRARQAREDETFYERER